MIYIIQDRFLSVTRYFAVNTLSLTGGLEWRDTPEDAFNFFVSDSDVGLDHSVAKDLANGRTLDNCQSIHSSYSPEEYPELFI